MATFYTALFTAGGEVTGTGYARKSTAFGISDGRTRNTATATWGPLTAAWGTITELRLFAALSGGIALHSGPLTTPVATQIGYRYRFNAGAIIFPEGLGDTFLGDEILGAQLELGYALPPVTLNEITVPPPSALDMRVIPWSRRIS